MLSIKSKKLNLAQSLVKYVFLKLKKKYPICCFLINKCVYLFNMIDNEKRFLSKVELMKVICDLVKSCKKCRMVSYVNNWWRFNGKNYLNIELEKVLKYRKNKDSNKLLMLGEWLILFVEEKH